MRKSKKQSKTVIKGNGWLVEINVPDWDTLIKLQHLPKKKPDPLAGRFSIEAVEGQRDVYILSINGKKAMGKFSNGKFIPVKKLA